MMFYTQKIINVLIGVLAAQAVLAALLLMPADQAIDPLVTFDFGTVDHIRIAGDEDQDEGPIEIFLGEGDLDTWTMPSNLPVDASRIESLSGVFTSESATWPVASTSDAARRFEVTEDDFQRRIELLAGDDEVATLYLGTSPGFRRIHAREADSEKIYSIELATYDLPLDRDDWIDKSLIAAPASIDSIARPGQWKVELDSEGEWTLPNSTRAANSSEISSMATRFETLRVMGIAEIAGKAPERAPDLEFIVSAAGVDVRYAFYRPPEDEGEGGEGEEDGHSHLEEEFGTTTKDTLVKSSLREEYFRVSSFTVDQLDKALEDLTEADSTPPQEAS